MRTAVFAFFISLVLAAALTPLVRWLSVARGWLDHNLEARKVHGQPLPRLGGVAIVIAFYAPLLGMLLYPTGMAAHFYAEPTRAYALMGGALCIALLGLYDDLRGAGAGIKLVVQVGVAYALWSLGFRIETIGLPGFTPIALGALSLPITILWIAGVVNAMNLIDGLDGLAGGVAFFALATSFIVAFLRGDAIMALLSAALAGSVLGFLVYNFNPASIFMGDSGSMFLGFVLAAGSVQTSQKSSTAVALLVPVVALGLPIADTLLAIARRAFSGRPIFSADRGHIHHRLLAVGLTHRQAVLALYGTTLLLCLFALALSFASSVETALALTALAMIGVIASRVLDKRRLPPTPNAPTPPRAAVRAAVRPLQGASSIEALFNTLVPVAESLGLSRMTISVGSRELGARVFHESVAAPRLSWPLGESGKGALEIAFRDGRARADAEQALALELLSDLITVALEQLR